MLCGVRRRRAGIKKTFGKKDLERQAVYWFDIIGMVADDPAKPYCRCRG